MVDQHYHQQRGYTEADWTGAQGDPILAVREVGYVTNTGEYVVGDGTTAFSGLTRLGSRAAEVVTTNAATTTDTITVGEEFTRQDYTDASLVTVTLDTNANQAFTTGEWIDVLASGAAGIEIAGATGVTVNGVAGTTTAVTLAQYESARLLYLGSDVWAALTGGGGGGLASATETGVVELATSAEVDTGTDTTRAVTPEALASSALQSKVDGIEPLADVTDTANIILADAFIVVNHGATAAEPRPSGAEAVYWIGSVEPDNLAEADLWYDTDGTASPAGTDLAWTASTSTVSSSTGTDATLTAVDGTNSGLMTVSDKSKLDAVEAAATADAATVSEVVATGATETLAFASGVDTQVHDITMDQNCTFSFSGAPSAGTLGTMTLLLSGAFTPTFPASVDWAGGTAPTYATPGIFEFWTIDGGSTVYGHDAGQGFA